MKKFNRKIAWEELERVWKIGVAVMIWILLILIILTLIWGHPLAKTIKIKKKPKSTIEDYFRSSESAGQDGLIDFYNSIPLDSEAK